MRKHNILILFPALFLAGCAASSNQTDINQRQDAALADPMHYSVDMQNTDINKGGIGGYDDAAMKRDLDAVGNP
jgi:hypothetical protein